LALAGLRELQLRHQQGELMEIATVEREAFRMGQIVRDHILNIPDRLAELLAVETDATKIHSLLTKELREALAALSRAPMEDVLNKRRPNGTH
jgi:hypothetical protein